MRLSLPTITVAALLQTAVPTAMAADQDGYTNPCKEFGTADKLNDLYNDPPPASGCPDGSDSYMCAGIFIRGIGSIPEGSPAPARPYFGTTIFQTPPIAPPVFTTGSSQLTSPVCPASIVDGGEYPWWCTTPQQIDLGATSFGYLRGDIAPPISILHEWEQTGKDPLTGWESKPRVLWPGPGIIFMQEAVNPDYVPSPQSSGSDASFWDNRIGRFWPHDGATKDRTLCGDGPTILAMMLGVGGPPVEIPDIGSFTQCPSNAPEWTDADLPLGYSADCPAAALESLEGYYNHTYEQTLMHIQMWKDFQENTPDEIFEAVQPIFANFADPTVSSCGIPAEKFDEVLVPANKYENWPEWRQEPNTELGMGGVGAWNEVSIRPWNGVEFDQLGAHLVLYSDDESNSDEDALEYARAFYNASDIGGGPAVRIPVVRVNMTSLYSDPSVDRPQVFTCVNSNDEQSTVSDTSGASMVQTLYKFSSVGATIFALVLM